MEEKITYLGQMESFKRYYDLKLVCVNTNLKRRKYSHCYFCGKAFQEEDEIFCLLSSTKGYRVICKDCNTFEKEGKK